jgi:hypothetical protein
VEEEGHHRRERREQRELVEEEGAWLVEEAWYALLVNLACSKAADLCAAAPAVGVDALRRELDFSYCGLCLGALWAIAELSNAPVPKLACCSQPPTRPAAARGGNDAGQWRRNRSGGGKNGAVAAVGRALAAE